MRHQLTRTFVVVDKARNIGQRATWSGDLSTVEHSDVVFSEQKLNVPHMAREPVQSPFREGGHRDRPWGLWEEPPNPHGRLKDRDGVRSQGLEQGTQTHGDSGDRVDGHREPGTGNNKSVEAKAAPFGDGERNEFSRMHTAIVSRQNQRRSDPRPYCG